MVPTALLIPGNMCDARLWQGGDGALAAALAARGLDVIHADTTRDAMIPAMAARAIAATPGQLLPIGFSMGANVAIELARIAPRRIAGLVLSSFNAGADRPERAAMRPAQQARVAEGGLAELVVAELKPTYLAANSATNDPSLKKLLLDMAIDLGPDVFLAQSEALRVRFDGREVLAAVDAPVLMLVGDEDSLCPPSHHRAVAAATRSATLAVVAGAGHMLPLEQPCAFADTIAAWLDHHPEVFA